MRSERTIIARKERDPFGALRLLRAGSFTRLAQIPYGAKNACSE